MIVKINTVYIPGINEDHIPAIAKKVGEMGVYTFNVIPLIAQYKFADITPPTQEMKRKMQDECSKYVKQMRHCQRCRADAIGKLGTMSSRACTRINNLALAKIFIFQFFMPPWIPFASRPKARGG